MSMLYCIGHNKKGDGWKGLLYTPMLYLVVTKSIPVGWDVEELPGVEYAEEV